MVQRTGLKIKKKMFAITDKNKKKTVSSEPSYTRNLLLCNYILYISIINKITLTRVPFMEVSSILRVILPFPLNLK